MLFSGQFLKLEPHTSPLLDTHKTIASTLESDLKRSSRAIDGLIGPGVPAICNIAKFGYWPMGQTRL